MSRTIFFVGCVLSLHAAAHADQRAIDGTGNNPGNPLMGCAGSYLQRGPSGAHYADGIGSPMNRPNARALSNALGAQTTGGLGNARGLSSWAWQWGQLIDHDFALINEGVEHMNISVPSGDPVFDPGHTGAATIPFERSAYADGVNTPRQHANVITHWIDGSMVYGSDQARADALRTGSGGRLATSAGDMLPWNTAGMPNGGGPGANLFLAGDIRANEQSGLLASHTILVREHNRLADQIATQNPTWSDEQVYQRARRFLGAEIQAITYNEWLPALLGDHATGDYAGYDQNVDASISTAFSTAGFRIGHTMLNDHLLRLNADGTEFAGGHLDLFEQFFNPTIITEPGSLDAVVRGLAAQQANEVDTQIIDGVRNLLFGGTQGRDLLALNLQRGRDHGLADYNTLRQDLGLPAVMNFGDITTDASLAAALQAAYGDVNNIDAWIGLFAEDHLPGASMGATAAAIFNDQFGRLRDGDRFFYLNDPTFTHADLAWLDGLTFADLIRLNTDADVQDAVFFTVPTPGAALVLISGLLMPRRRREVVPAN